MPSTKVTSSNKNGNRNEKKKKNLNNFKELNKRGQIRLQNRSNTVTPLRRKTLTTPKSESSIQRINDSDGMLEQVDWENSYGGGLYPIHNCLDKCHKQ